MPAGLRIVKGQGLAATMRRRVNRLPVKFAAADLRTAQKAKELARTFTSAPRMSRTEKKSHPYARRSPHPPLPPYMVHRESGRLEAGWKVRQTGKVTVLYNDAAIAGFFNGQPTKTMMGRPVVQEVARRIRPERMREGVKAMREVLSGR